MYVVNEGEVDRFSSPEELNNIYINSRNKWTETFDSIKYPIFKRVFSYLFQFLSM